MTDGCYHAMMYLHWYNFKELSGTMMYFYLFFIKKEKMPTEKTVGSKHSSCFGDTQDRYPRQGLELIITGHPHAQPKN